LSGQFNDLDDRVCVNIYLSFLTGTSLLWGSNWIRWVVTSTGIRSVIIGSSVNRNWVVL